MKAKFIEDAGTKLALQFEPETDDERLLLRSFSAQCEPNNLLRIVGRGMGGEYPGLRHVRVFQAQEPAPVGVERLREAIDDRDFYELMQIYRHSEMNGNMSVRAHDAFEAVKAYVMRHAALDAEQPRAAYLKHGPGGTGLGGPCDPDCAKCRAESARPE